MAHHTIDDLFRWMETTVARWGRLDRVLRIDKFEDGVDDGEKTRTFRGYIYTATNEYRIYATEREGGRGYLGCGASSRTPRPGETRTRGNDLPDGPLTPDTWRQIVNAILGYELVTLAKGVPHYPPGSAVEEPRGIPDSDDTGSDLPGDGPTDDSGISTFDPAA